MASTQKTWPEAGRSLVAELAAAPGRIGLVVGGSARERTLDLLAEAVEMQVVSAGRVLTDPEAPASIVAVRELLRDAQMIDDTDVLFTPELAFDLLAWHRDASRRHPVFVRWPGAIDDRIATYSEPGRRDHYERRLANAIVLRQIERAFPDQSPYRIERIP